MTKLHKALLARLDKAAWEYKMFDDNDTVVMACSGGADSMALLELLTHRINVYAENIKLYAVYVDMGFGSHIEHRCNQMQAFFQSHNLEYSILRTDMGPYAHSENNRENPCFLCAKMRRKIIFETADELGCNKIAFGHHKDDIIETLFINMFYNREISTMAPKLEVFQGKFQLLRPLVYIEEELIKKFIREQNINLVDQECPTDGHSKRQFIKNLLNQLETQVQGVRQNIFVSMKHVKSDYLL